MNLPHFHHVAQNTKQFQMWDKVGQRIKLRKKKTKSLQKAGELLWGRNSSSRCSVDTETQSGGD